MLLKCFGKVEIKLYLIMFVIIKFCPSLTMFHAHTEPLIGPSLQGACFCAHCVSPLFSQHSSSLCCVLSSVCICVYVCV